MIADPRHDHATLPAIIAVSVGNTTTRWGVFDDAASSLDCSSAGSCAADDAAAAADLIARADAGLEGRSRVVLVASVNPGVSRSLVELLRSRLTTRIATVPEDVPVPIRTALAPGATPGVDRLLAAVAAFAVIGQACAVIDAGTAMTVNFVDGEGTFQGGVIAPGVRMALRAMHQHTAGLPAIEFREPDIGWIGKDTTQAMLQGVLHGARGLARAVVERYAEAYEAYPFVIACGGDAAVLFGDDEFVDRVVPDLVLRGMAVAFRHTLLGEDDHGPSARDASFGDRDGIEIDEPADDEA